MYFTLASNCSFSRYAFLIDKETVDDKTTTIVRKLEDEERIDELSRLLGGVDLTDTTKLHAKEMLEMSKRLNGN